MSLCARCELGAKAGSRASPAKVRPVRSRAPVSQLRSPTRNTGRCPGRAPARYACLNTVVRVPGAPSIPRILDDSPAWPCAPAAMKPKAKVTSRAMLYRHNQSTSNERTRSREAPQTGISCEPCLARRRSMTSDDSQYLMLIRYPFWAPLLVVR